MLRLWLIIASFVLSACSLSNSAMSVTTRELAQAECERGNGVWREVLHFCEYRSGC